MSISSWDFFFGEIACGEGCTYHKLSSLYFKNLVFLDESSHMGICKRCPSVPELSSLVKLHAGRDACLSQVILPCMNLYYILASRAYCSFVHMFNWQFLHCHRLFHNFFLAQLHSYRGMSSNWDPTAGWQSSLSQSSSSMPLGKCLLTMSSQVVVCLSNTSCSCAAACTYAQVGPTFVGGEGQHDQMLTLSHPIHSLESSTPTLSVLDSAPASIPLTTSGDGHLTGSNPW